MEFEFKMTDLGNLSYFLGMEFVKTPRRDFDASTKISIWSPKMFRMLECNTTTPAEVNVKLVKDNKEVDITLYKLMKGSLKYVCNNKLNICYAVGLISRFISEPKSSNLIAAKMIMRYLKGTLDFGVLFLSSQNNMHVNWLAFFDFDWCRDKSDTGSTSEYIFKFLGAPISRCSKKTTCCSFVKWWLTETKFDLRGVFFFNLLVMLVMIVWNSSYNSIELIS